MEHHVPVIWNNVNMNSENVFSTNLSVHSKVTLNSLVLPFQKEMDQGHLHFPFGGEEPKFSHGQGCFELGTDTSLLQFQTILPNV